MEKRTCHRCKKSLPATPEFFVRDKSRLLGIAYECRGCHSERRKGRDRRKERWSNMTPAQKDKCRARQKRYGKTHKGRACYLRKAYLNIDDCDLSTDEIVEIIKQPCTFCGTTDYNRGLDRIDNSKAHVKGNVQAACVYCNFTKGDRFTDKEMKILGKTIKKILKGRKTKEVPNEVRQGNSHR